MGLFSLAGELVNDGFDTKILHLGVEKYLDKDFLLSDYIKKHSIKYAAFTLQWCQQAYDVIETTRAIKEKCPDVYITLGGYTASFFAKEILEKFSHIDGIFKGESEVPTVKLANALYNKKSLDGIPNLYWRKNGKIILNDGLYVAANEDLNRFEFFNSERMLHYDEYSRISYELDFEKENQLVTPSTSLNICLGRGCMGNCVHCGGSHSASKLVSGRDFVSYRSAEKVISEMKLMQDKFGINVFRFGFDPNNRDRSYFIDLFKKVKKEFSGKITIMYDLEGLPDKKVIDAFKECGNTDSILSITPISYSEDLRRKYKSFFFTNKQLEEVLEYLELQKILSELYFLGILGIKESENTKSKEYGESLAQRFNYVTASYYYDMEIVPASHWTLHPQKYNLKNFNTTFMEYYEENRGLKNSFESMDFCIRAEIDSVAKHQ